VHELSIAQEVHRAARAATAGYGAHRLERVIVAVGELTAIEPELLRYAWEAVVAGGPDAACELVVEWRPARQFCQTCAQSKPRGTGRWLQTCPDCDGLLRVDGGDELEVLRVSFLADDEECGGGHA
jgi:hydrogenase nickel incorporation protein HypA/HybF